MRGFNGPLAHKITSASPQSYVIPSYVARGRISFYTTSSFR